MAALRAEGKALRAIAETGVARRPMLLQSTLNPNLHIREPYRARQKGCSASNLAGAFVLILKEVTSVVSVLPRTRSAP